MPSKQWSCSELCKGAKICADLAGLSLVRDPHGLSREDLLRSIKDFAVSLHVQHQVLLFLLLREEAKALMKNPEKDLWKHFSFCSLSLVFFRLWLLACCSRKWRLRRSLQVKILPTWRHKLPLLEATRKSLAFAPQGLDEVPFAPPVEAPTAQPTEVVMTSVNASQT